MFPLFPLALSGIATYLSQSWLTARAEKDPEFIPRFGESGKGSDARAWGVGAGLLSLLLGPAWPLIGAIGVGVGVGSMVSYQTSAKIKACADAFIAQQQITQAGPAGFLPGMDAMPEAIRSLFEGEMALPM